MSKYTGAAKKKNQVATRLSDAELQELDWIIERRYKKGHNSSNRSHVIRLLIAREYSRRLSYSKKDNP